MFQNLFKRLECPDRPLLGPNFKALQFWGLIFPKTTSKILIFIILQVLIITFFITECIDIYFVKNDINMLLTNVKITLLAAVSFVKVLSFFFWQKKWIRIIEYVTRADLSLRESEDKTAYITKYTKYCRKLTFLCWFFMSATVFSVLLQPLVKYALSPEYRLGIKNGTESYAQVISSWVPFDKSALPGYIAASVYQSFGNIFGGGMTASLDSNSIVLMAFVKAEMEMLRVDAAEIFGNGDVGRTEARRRLRDCHRRFGALVENTRLLNSCLSPIMFIYIMSVCSVMLCATFYQLSIEKNPLQRVLISIYLVFGIFQLFVFCWHSNEVFYASKDLMLGPYESKWQSRSTSEQKNIIILIKQFSQTIVFTAGPFSNLDNSIFINILKGAYSYYTLLS